MVEFCQVIYRVKRLELVFVNQVSRKVIHSCIVSFNEEDVKNRIIDVLEKYGEDSLNRLNHGGALGVVLDCYVRKYFNYS